MNIPKISEVCEYAVEAAKNHIQFSTDSLSEPDFAGSDVILSASEVVWLRQFRIRNIFAAEKTRMTMRNRRIFIVAASAAVLLATTLTACKPRQKEEETGRSFPVMAVSSRHVEFTETYSASIKGRQDVDIIPQVSGRVTRLCVKEGERVRKGQVLAILDQVPYQAAYRTASANVNAALAKVETARIELAGKQSLFDERVISDYELSLAKNSLAVAQAELEQAEAQKLEAGNNLSYTEIKSPSDGVVGTLPYRVGALVGPSISEPFTQVSDNSEMYAYFSVSENKLRQLTSRYGSVDGMISGMNEVGLQLNDGSIYSRKGRLETVSGVVNPTTGAVQLKVLFPNPDHELMSGSVGNVIIQSQSSDAVVIPISTTFELQDKIVAYRVKDGLAEAAYLSVDRLNGGREFVVRQGLSVGDTIVAEGVGLVREGMKVTTETESR